jgi:hypothetical protein
MIVGIEPSPVKYKRFRVTVNTAQGQKKVDFGLQGGSTFIDGESEAALFSAFLLWGKYRSVDKNIKYLNNLWYK